MCVAKQVDAVTTAPHMGILLPPRGSISDGTGGGLACRLCGRSLELPP